MSPCLCGGTKPSSCAFFRPRQMRLFVTHCRRPSLFFFLSACCLWTFLLTFEASHPTFMSVAAFVSVCLRRLSNFLSLLSLSWVFVRLGCCACPGKKARVSFIVTQSHVDNPSEELAGEHRVSAHDVLFPFLRLLSSTMCHLYFWTLRERRSRASTSYTLSQRMTHAV